MLTQSTQIHCRGSEEPNQQGCICPGNICFKWSHHVDEMQDCWTKIDGGRTNFREQRLAQMGRCWETLECCCSVWTPSTVMKETLYVSMEVMIIKANESNNKFPLYVSNSSCSGSPQHQLPFQIIPEHRCFLRWR